MKTKEQAATNAYSMGRIPKVTINKVVKYLYGNRNRLIHNNQQQMKYDLATSKIKSAKSIAEIKSQLEWLTNSPNSISEEILKIVK